MHYEAGLDSGHAPIHSVVPTHEVTIGFDYAACHMNIVDDDLRHGG
jgi:hypothetical protein